jgi:shikimate kinase
MTNRINPVPILLLGMKHSGKSTHGRRLAGYLNADFYDLDDIIEELHDPSRQVTCREIFRSHGSAFFAQLEARAALILASRMAQGPAVAALGGGTIENAEAMKALKDSGVRVYLRNSLETLYKRIMKHGVPPFLDPDDPHGGFEGLYARRTPLYEANADLVVNLEGLSLDEAFTRLVACLETKSAE